MYADATKAKAVALVQSGEETVTTAAERLDLPCVRTVERWVAECRKLSVQEGYPDVIAGWQRIALMGQALIYDGMEEMHRQSEEGNKDLVLKHFSGLSLTVGLGTDKQARAVAPAAAQVHGPIVIVVGAPEPAKDVIEGELA